MTQNSLFLGLNNDYLMRNKVVKRGLNMTQNREKENASKFAKITVLYGFFVLA